MLGREAKVGNEVLEVVLQALDGRRVELAPLRGEGPARLRATAWAADPGAASMSSKIRQNSAFTCAWAWTGTLAKMLGPVDEALLASRAAENGFQRRR